VVHLHSPRHLTGPPLEPMAGTGCADENRAPALSHVPQETPDLR